MKILRSLISLLLILVLTIPAAQAGTDTTDFVADDDIVSGQSFTLDGTGDAGAGDIIKLEFGATLAEFLQFDVDDSRFELSDDLSIEGNQFVNFRVENLGADPGTCNAAAEGRIYYNTGSNVLRFCNGSAWGTVDTGGTNADTLDTLDSLQFLRSDTGDNFTSGTLTFDAGTTADVNGVLDLANSTRVAMRAAASDPGTCTVGDLYFNTTDNLLRACSATNTWSVVRDGGNADTVDTLEGSDLLRSNASDNFTTGTLTFDGGTTLQTDGSLDANGVVTIGDNGDNVTIDSSSWDISSAGVASGFTGFTTTGGVDFSGASSFLNRTNAGEPGTCTVGEQFYDTSSNQLKVCTATNTWTALGAGSSDADTLDTLDSLQFLRSDTGDSFTSGTLTFDAGTTADVNGVLDLANATRVAMRTAASDPGTCTVGDLYFNTTDNLLRACSATNTWSVIRDGGNADTVDTLEGSDLLRSNASDNFTTGTLTFDAGTTADVNGVLDLANATRVAMRVAASDPGTCTVGDLYFNSTDNLLRACSATNTWSVIRDGGDADTVDTFEGSDLLRSNASDNFTTGTLTFDGGTTLDVDGVAALGDGGDDIAIDSNDWDISSAGVASGFTGLTTTGAVDLTGTNRVAMRTETSDPGTCTVGDLYFNTTDNLLRACSATNTWSVVRDGGDANTLDTLDSLQFIRSDATDSYTSGTLTFSGGTTLQADGTFDANGVVTIGDNGDTVAIDSSAWDISTTGAASGFISLDVQATGELIELGNATAADAFINFDDGTDRNFGWDDSEGAISTFDNELRFRTRQSATVPVACSSTVAGMQWMDTDTGQLYICDTSNSRNKWLSAQDLVIFGDESGACDATTGDPNGDADCNADWGNGLGPDTATDLGFYIPHPITITGYGFSSDNDACTSGSFDVEVWSTGSNSDDNTYTLEQEVATGLDGQAHNSSALNVDIAGDQYILWGLDNNCGQAIDDWNVILYFRYRHN